MNDEPEFELVMPFVVTASHGGLYDDDAYTAGWELGSINRMLETLPPEVHELSITIRTANSPQLDLIAMRHKWMTDVAVEDGFWSLMDLTRIEDA